MDILAKKYFQEVRGHFSMACKVATEGKIMENSSRKLNRIVANEVQEVISSISCFLATTEIPISFVMS